MCDNNPVLKGLLMVSVVSLLLAIVHMKGNKEQSAQHVPLSVCRCCLPKMVPDSSYCMF